jgi:hypothetical protein
VLRERVTGRVEELERRVEARCIRRRWSAQTRRFRKVGWRNGLILSDLRLGSQAAHEAGGVARARGDRNAVRRARERFVFANSTVEICGWRGTLRIMRKKQVEVANAKAFTAYISLTSTYLCRSLWRSIYGPTPLIKPCNAHSLNQPSRTDQRDRSHTVVRPQ